MPITLPPALVRTNYFQWPPGLGGMYDPNADPDNPSADPSQADPISEVVLSGNAVTDEEQYFRPLERLHGMGLHAPGVGYGMQLICTIGDSGVQITPGIALDPSGKHIFLASGGAAAVGPGIDAVGSFPATIGVSAAGAILDTTGYTGEYYIIAQWWESWNVGQYYNSGVNTFSDTPWLQFVTSGEYDPDIHVPLGKVYLDGSSIVTEASYGDVGGIQRTSVSIPVQSVQLFRAASTTSGTVQAADTVLWGEVRAREAGGIEIITQNAGDQVNITGEGGGSFSSMSVATGTAAFGDISNPSIVLDTNEATLKVGAPGNYGDVNVYDGYNHLAVALVGDDGHIVVGGQTLNGKIRMLDSNAQQTMTLEGQSGSAVVQNLTAFSNDTIDVHTTYFHCHATDFCLDGKSHHNKRALVDGGNQLIVNDHHDYGKGVIINGLQNPVARLGPSGSAATEIGIISGTVMANSGSDGKVTGGVTLNFHDHAFTGGSSDFDPGSSFVMGFKGTFTDTPHVIFVPNLFNLTTGEVFSGGFASASPNQVQFNWSYNAGGAIGDQQWQVLVIGPIAPEFG